MDANTFQPEVYSQISLSDLLTYCVYLLESEKRKANFEDIVAKCFELFPERFSLTGYPQWPDSSRVNKVWLRCRTDKYIKGSVKAGFTVTPKGLDVGERVQKKISTPIDERVYTKKRQARERTREELFIRKLEGTEAYQRYMEVGKSTEISHYEFCDMLFCTLESSAESLRENLESLLDFSAKLKHDKAVKFLKFAEENFHSILYPDKPKNKFKGGMQKKKLGE